MPVVARRSGTAWTGPGAGAAAPARMPATGTSTGTASSGRLLALFTLTLFMPVFFHLGELRLTPFRVLLLVLFVPLFLRWISGSAGRIAGGDVVMGLYCLWMSLAVFVNHGSERIPFIGITAAELFGGYLVGRVLVRSEADFRAFFRYFAIGLAVALPLVAVEMLTARMLLADILGPFGGTFGKAMLHDQRWGLYRAQLSVEHPILWGVVCSIAIANLLHLHRLASPGRGLALSGLATLLAFSSLSSAPMLSAMLQAGMTAWGWITRNAWWALVGLVVAAYVVVDLLSNRSPVQVLISYATFNAQAGYMRLHIWDHGILNVWANPVFGIGLHDWVRPPWLAPSVDNFWLVTAMRYGIPGFLLLALALGLILARIVRARLPAPVAMLRQGYVIAALGTVLTLGTVHVWGATGVLVMFYFGAGAWFFNGVHPAAGEAPAAAGAPAAAARRTARRTALRRPPRPPEAPAAAAEPAPPRRRVGYTRARAEPLPRRPAPVRRPKR